MKKVFKIILIIFMILLMACLGLYRFFSGPSVSFKDKAAVKEYSKNYLIGKYGDHNYKITGVRYEYDMETIFDYSNPVGYWVDFKSDAVSDSWMTINGLTPDEYEVNSDYLIQDYYFPDMDGYDVGNIMDNMKPRKEIESIFLGELKNNFEPDIYEIECDYIHLDIPDDFGRIPTLDELKTNVDFYKISSFDYKVSESIEDVGKYEERLKTYIKNKYNIGLDVYFHLDNILVSVFLDEAVAVGGSPVDTIQTDFATYYKMSDGTWECEDHIYKYRLEISGRMPNSAKDTTYVYLSNLEEISFYRAMMANGLSSNMNYYFSAEEAILVEIR